MQQSCQENVETIWLQKDNYCSKIHKPTYLTKFVNMEYFPKKEQVFLSHKRGDVGDVF